MDYKIEDENINAYDIDLKSGKLDPFIDRWVAYVDGNFLGGGETSEGLLERIVEQGTGKEAFLTLATKNPEILHIPSIKNIEDMDQA